MKEDNAATSSKVTPAIKGSLIAIRFFAIVAFALALMVILMHVLRPKQHFYVADSGGSKHEIFPLNEPNVTPSSLIRWATQAATNAYTIDFFHYQDNIEALRDYFTIAGYQAFLKSLDDSGTLKRIIKDNLVQSAVATDTAVVSLEGDQSGTYVWQIQVPLLVTYQGASTESVSKQIVVGLLVTRVPTDQAPKGIGIAQIVDSEMNG